MQKISNSVQLQEAITLLEYEQAEKAQALKQQFRLTYESLKPANLFLSAINDISSSPHVLDNVLGTSAGILSGFLSRKAFVGASGNQFRKLIGSLLQFGVSNLVANNAGIIKTLGKFVAQNFFHSKTRKESEDE